MFLYGIFFFRIWRRCCWRYLNNVPTPIYQRKTFSQSPGTVNQVFVGVWASTALTVFYFRIHRVRVRTEIVPVVASAWNVFATNYSVLLNRAITPSVWNVSKSGQRFAFIHLLYPVAMTIANRIVSYDVTIRTDACVFRRLTPVLSIDLTSTSSSFENQTTPQKSSNAWVASAAAIEIDDICVQRRN